MELLKIEGSSSVEAIGFDAEQKIIRVQFTSGTYDYQDCTEDEFQQIYLAKSIGSKISELLKKTKEFKKV